MDIKISIEQFKELIECTYLIRDLTQESMNLDKDVATTLDYYDTIVKANFIAKGMIKELEEKADKIIAHHNYTKKIKKEKGE